MRADQALEPDPASRFDPRDAPLPGNLAAIGEISLAGEVRAASASDRRRSEGARLGFSTIVGDEAATLREALRRAFAAAQSDGPAVPDF